MRLRLSTEGIDFQCSGNPGPKLDQNGRQKADREGAPMWTTQVIAQEIDGAEVLTVTVAGVKPSVTVGQRVSVVGLEAIPWNNNGKHGVAFRAEQISPVAATATK
jgi:hypothetical protein